MAGHIRRNKGAIQSGLCEAGLPPECVQTVPTTSRSIVAAMLAGEGQLDLLIPRGGKSLIQRVTREACVPVLSHAERICHAYIHQDADPDMVLTALLNAKLRRTSVFGATEALLIYAQMARLWLPKMQSVPRK